MRELQREGVQDGEEDCPDPAVSARERIPAEDFQFLGSGERGAFIFRRWIIEADTIQMPPIAIARKVSYSGTSLSSSSSWGRGTVWTLLRLAGIAVWDERGYSSADWRTYWRTSGGREHRNR